MIISKFEIEGAKEEVFQFLDKFGDIKGLNFTQPFDSTQEFEELTKKLAERFNDNSRKTENTKSIVDDKVQTLVEEIIARFKRREFKSDQMLTVADKLISYANKKSRLESEKG